MNPIDDSSMHLPDPSRNAAPTCGAHPAAGLVVDIQWANPLQGRAHLRKTSRYMDSHGGSLSYRTRPHEPVTAQDRQTHDSLRDHVLDRRYPCVMARSAFNTRRFRVATYGLLGAAENAPLLCHDVYEFCSEFPTPVDGAVSFIACFENGAAQDEVAFETALWSQLQSLHDVDKRNFAWAADVESAPERSEFSFSVGGRAFFLIGMHPKASRMARRAAMPAIVFNLHEQFVELREGGKFDRIRDTVQARDVQLQGSANPMAADFGARSEVAQYSGRAVARDWKCPFIPGEASFPLHPT